MALLLWSSGFLFGQSAQLSGLVLDPSSAPVQNARLELRNRDTGVRRQTLTSQEGLYSFLSLKAGTYQATLQIPNFRTITRESIVLDVGDRAGLDFQLQLARKEEQVTVTADHAVVNPLDPAVSTVVDQDIVQNMPLNGRSFQSLIALAPGVVFTSRDLGVGQFSVNGQRSTANYFIVDGVGANFGLVGTIFFDQTLGGVTPPLTLDGGTNGLVSVDAMEEFRIQTSTYAPEFGRTPGASISILTKSGTNQFHGTAFDYLRNEIFDARNYYNTPPQPKPPLRQNDFGGTLGGPLVRNKTFFFCSYEGLRLRLPRTNSGMFYTQSARDAVAPAYRPFMNALPLPTGVPIDPKCDNITVPCVAPLTAVYSNPSNVNATGIRGDHNLGGRLMLFARYNHAPSQFTTKSFNSIGTSAANLDTFTAGATILFSGSLVNESRGNWSRYRTSSERYLTESYGAVVPLEALMFPSSFSPVTNQALVFFPDNFAEVRAGKPAQSSQQQLNFVNVLGWSSGAHQFKTGIDYRVLNTSAGQLAQWSVFPASYASLVAGTFDSAIISGREALSMRIHNWSLFGQDTWRSTDRLTLTYGLRWEINTPPVSTLSVSPLYLTRGIFDTDPLALAPASLWRTQFGNFAPRFGAAYRATPGIVIRGGFGLFYDLGYGNVGNATGHFPYQRSLFINDPTLPFNPAAFRIPPVSLKLDPTALLSLPAVDPNLALPFTMQWNTAAEVGLGAKQTLTATYVGANGRRLLRQAIIHPAEFAAFLAPGTVLATQNGGYSHYNALQVQFQRRMSQGLQVLLSYSLAKSSDTGSSDQYFAWAPAATEREIVSPPLAPSSFDIRHSLSAAVSYEIPSPAGGAVRKALLKGWALDGLLRVSSPPPVNVRIRPVGFVTSVQPDIVPGEPLLD